MTGSKNGKKTVTILGSSGSIGCSTLDLIQRNPDSFSITALTAHCNLDKLVEQALAFRPRYAVIGDESLYADLKQALSGTGIEAAAGRDAVIDAARHDAEFVMAAIVGAAGLEPTLEAVKRGADVGLANKECLVCAGELMTHAVSRSNARLLPVDSEHNAIFQVFDFEQADRVSRIILTASGGPFRTRPRNSLGAITPEEAVAHPNWSMGAKISVDSATMMNKGLELIEAFHLFPVTEKQIEIVVHPQSVIHSMVEYCDGSVLAQLGSPDMRTPIAYCMAWPERMPSPSEKLDFAKLARLDFEDPDPDRFPALRLTRQALIEGGAAPTILNAANEIAVDAFLNRQLSFLGITDLVEECLSASEAGMPASIDDVIEVDRRARLLAQEKLALRSTVEPVKEAM